MSNNRMPFNKIKEFGDIEITLNPMPETEEYLDEEIERGRRISKMITEIAREIGKSLEGIALDIAVDELIQNKEDLKDFIKRMNERVERARESEKDAIKRSIKNIDEKIELTKKAHAYRRALMEVKWITESGLYNKRQAFKKVKETVNKTVMEQEEEN